MYMTKSYKILRNIYGENKLHEIEKQLSFSY